MIKIVVSLCAMLGVSAQAATCSLNVIGINFGAYNVFSTTPVDGVGTIDVTCDARTAFEVSFSTGLSGTYTTRQMAYGSSRLNYNLYRNAAMNRILGDGTGNTQVFSVNNARNRSFTVYGRVPAQQNVYVGSYADNVTVTLTF
ncbi:MAG TPA: spore coat U domain-containing protein [Agitococcus sp.]|nr:spore coat U domain-containing protein [Agitococcus sp.]